MDDPSENLSRPFQPTATWEVLERRAELLQRLRQFFTQRGFLEVETPLLSRDSIVDVHLEPFAVTAAGTSDAKR